MRTFILTLLLLATVLITNAQAIDCTKHKSFCQIVRNKPSINKKYAMKLSNIIHKMTIKHKIPKHIFTGILMQESGYQVGSTACVVGLNGDDEVMVCTDFGIAQIHYKNLKGYGFDVDKLLADMVYSVEAGAIVLSYFHKRYKNEKDFWVRYNCGTRGTTNRQTCKIYKQLVERYL